MQSILLVEDSAEFPEIVRAALGDLSVRLVVAGTCEEARRQLRASPVDLVLLDVMLPDCDGFTLCEEIRKDDSFKHLPIIFLTGKSEISDRERGFSLKAEDYIVKPIEPREFRARIQARLSNILAAQQEKVLVKGPLRLDFALQRAFLKEGSGERDLHLTPAEFRILALLGRYESRVFSGRELIQSVWGEEVHVVDHNLYTHIYALRKKLADSSKLVESLPRGGYRLNLEAVKS